MSVCSPRTIRNMMWKSAPHKPIIKITRFPLQSLWPKPLHRRILLNLNRNPSLRKLVGRSSSKTRLPETPPTVRLQMSLPLSYPRLKNGPISTRVRTKSLILLYQMNMTSGTWAATISPGLFVTKVSVGLAIRRGSSRRLKLALD